MMFAGPELERNVANHTALSPVSILKRVERVHPEMPAQIHGSVRRNWGEVAERCKRLASALAKPGIGKGDTVALIAQNIPEGPECAPAFPMLGAVLKTTIGKFAKANSATWSVHKADHQPLRGARS